MNYRHAYHAGSFADVFKHIVLVAILDTLQQKDKGFCYLDTHAGIGKYNLQDIRARKTKEFLSGIAKIITHDTRKPADIVRYLQIVRGINTDGGLQYYPGSPLIARTLLRPQDKMILTEQHPVDHNLLQQLFKYDRQTAVHEMDGYQGLKAFLPPQPRRGMVLIDPPYESTDEFGIILKNLSIALTRWKEGIYVIWYPVKNRPRIQLFLQKLQRLYAGDKLVAEFNLYPDDSPMTLNGSGLAIINPPFQLDKKLRRILPWLQTQFDPTKSGNFKLTIFKAEAKK